MNISKSRSESAPYSLTTSSGLMTLPRAFDILCARASTGTDGSVLSTNPSPFFSTWSSVSRTASLLAGIGGRYPVGPVPVAGEFHFAQDHALIDQLPERLRARQMAAIVQNLVPKPRIEQVQDRMLGPADVQVHRQPVLCLSRERVDCHSSDRDSEGNTSTTRPTAASCSSHGDISCRRGWQTSQSVGF